MNTKKVIVIHPTLWSHYKAIVFSELYTACDNEHIELKVLQVAITASGRRNLGSVDRSLHRYPCTLLFEKEMEQIGIFERVSRLIREVNAYRPDVAILPGYAHLSYWFVLALMKLVLKKSVIVSMDSTANDHPRTLWKEKIKNVFMSLCDGAFCYGTASSEYAENLGIPRNKIYIRYQATDNNRIREVFDSAVHDKEVCSLKYGFKNKNFVFAGRLSAEKNIITLLEAFKITKARLPNGVAWGLIIVGDGPQRQELERFVELNGIVDVFFVGGRSWDEVPVFYAVSNVFILPSYSEPWGLVVNEAMVCGLPVIVSNKVGAAIDLVRDGVNGYQFNPKSTDELAAIMAKFPNREVDAEAMGQKSLEIIEQYSPKNAAGQMLAGIKKVLGI